MIRAGDAKGSKPIQGLFNADRGAWAINRGGLPLPRYLSG